MNCIACVGICAALAAAGGALQPAVFLPLDGHLHNFGTAGGEARFVEYAPGEGPDFAPGLVGAGVSFESASRSGGTTNKPAGGAVAVDAPKLQTAKRFTLALWVRTHDARGPARLVYLAGAWDLMLTAFRLSLKIERDGDLHFCHQSRASDALLPGQWNFVAVAVDGERGEVRMYVGRRSSPPQLIGRWTDVPKPGRGRGPIEVGNLRGIRPLRGRVDNVRVFDAALSDEQVAGLWKADVAAAGWLLSTLPGPKLAFDGLKRSDVCFSTRWARPQAPDVARAFHATKVVWVYTADRKFIDRLHGAGLTVQATINSVTRCQDRSAYAVDLDGNNLVAPWMVSFKPPRYWGCNNQPAYRQATAEQAFRALDAGADWIQFDDWALICSAHRFGGGCFCDRCMAGFREYLKSLPPDQLKAAGITDADHFDYRRFLRERFGIATAKQYMARYRDLPTTTLFQDFQRRSVREFFDWLRGELDRHAARRVPLSINANLHQFSQFTNFLADMVDFYLGETHSTDDLAHLAVVARAADAMGRLQIVSPFPRNVAQTRQALAATYALGHLFLAPWDIWMGPQKPRFFGKPDDYADLYEFVRATASLLDDAHAPAAVGVLVDTDHFDYGWARDAAARLLEANVPFVFVPVGHRYYDLSLQADKLQRLRALVVPDELELTEADAAALDAARRATAVLTLRELTDGLLAAYRPVEVWAPEGVYCIVRVRGGEHPAVVCHLLNRTAVNGRPPALDHVAIGLRRDAAGARQIGTAIWHAPGQRPRQLPVEELTDYWRVVVPRLLEWGIVEMSLK